MSRSGVALFRHKGQLYAVEDRCSHGSGSLSCGDIEDIDPNAVACGSLPTKTACVRCPRHRGKFAGGLWYSLETGESITLGETSNYAPIYRVGAFSVKEEDGNVYVSKVANTRSPSLKFADKFNIRVHKVAKALGCGCFSGNSGKVPIKSESNTVEWSMWSVVSHSNVSADCLLVHMSRKDGVKGADNLTSNHLWHVSLRLEVQGEIVER